MQEACLERYRSYKSSDIPWLGDLPTHWRTLPLKRVSTIVAGQSPASESVSEYLGDSPFLQGNAEFGRVHPSARLACESPPKRARVGDILLSVRAPVGALNVADQAYGIGRGLCAVRIGPELHRSYAHYALGLSLQELLRLSTGSTYGAVTAGIVGGLTFPLPRLPEQTAIVRYLNHVDRQVRRYMTTMRKFTLLLEEEKHAGNQQAVTRGLDPDVPLKPSGVEWLGDVPEHWEVLRNGRLFAQRQEKGFPKLPILEVSLKTGVSIRDFENSGRNQMMAIRGGYQRAVRGDIAYNMMRMWQGAVGIAPVDGLVSPAYVVAKPLRGTEPRYFSALFRTSAYMAEVDKHSRGIVKDRNRLYWEDFKRIPTPCPPLHEQVQIADAIDQRVQTVEVVVNHMRRKIELLREYRTRLIADVVTGKLDVREAAAQLPSDADYQDPMEAGAPTADGQGEAIHDPEEEPAVTEEVVK